MLRQLLQKYGFTIPIEAYLVFINPEFTLYQPSKNQQIILPSQVNRFINKLNSSSSKKLNDWHRKLGDQLVSLHQTDNPYTFLPNYDYGQLRKGRTCYSCNSFSISVGRMKITCNRCGNQEWVESSILRSVVEVRILFPGKKITTSLIRDWFKVIESNKPIRRVLKKNFKAIGHTKERYYL